MDVFYNKIHKSALNFGLKEMIMVIIESLVGIKDGNRPSLS